MLGSIASAVIGNKGASKASKAQVQAAQMGIDAQKEIYGKNQVALAPFQSLGAPAGQQINALLGLSDDPAAAAKAFEAYRGSTGYDFRVKQGQNALNSGYAGSGTLQSGAALKGLDDYRQGMASAEFGNYLNALGNQQSLGFSAASALAGVGQNYANSVGNLYQDQGNARANAALTKAQNTSNAVQSGINSLFSIVGGGGGFGKSLGKIFG